VCVLTYEPRCASCPCHIVFSSFQVPTPFPSPRIPPSAASQLAIQSSLVQSNLSSISHLASQQQSRPVSSFFFLGSLCLVRVRDDSVVAVCGLGRAGWRRTPAVSVSMSSRSLYFSFSFSLSLSLLSLSDARAMQPHSATVCTSPRLPVCCRPSRQAGWQAAALCDTFGRNVCLGSASLLIHLSSQQQGGCSDVAQAVMAVCSFLHTATTASVMLRMRARSAASLSISGAATGWRKRGAMPVHDTIESVSWRELLGCER